LSVGGTLAVTSTSTFGNNVTIDGNLTVNGTTTTVNSTTVTYDDPILTLGGDTSTAETSKDRGIESKWAGTILSVTPYIGNGTTTVTGTVISTVGYNVGDIITISNAVGTEQSKLNGTWKIASVPGATTFTFVVNSAVTTGNLNTNLGTTIKSKNAFFGLDQSTGRFTFIPQSNNENETFSGSVGVIEASDIYLGGSSTGTGVNVRASSPTITTPTITTPTITALKSGNAASTIYDDSSSATIKIGATNGTGTISLGVSTSIQKIEIAAASTGSDKTIDIGTNGTAGNDTIVNIGSTTTDTTTTVTINGKLITNSFVMNVKPIAVTGNTTLDLSKYNNFHLTLSNSTAATISVFSETEDLKIGSSGVIIIEQDTTGGRVILLDQKFKTPLSQSISWVTTGNSISLLSYYVVKSDFIIANYIGNFG
jgi:hypothetical protein